MGMRYPDGGGLSAAGRAQREAVRFQAGRMFDQGVGPVRVARDLRVSTKSAYQWSRRWRGGCDAALASAGPGVGRARPCRMIFARCYRGAGTGALHCRKLSSYLLRERCSWR